MLTLPRTPVVLSFIVDLTSLLLFGPRAALLVAAARTVAVGLVRLKGPGDPIPSAPALNMAVNLVTALAAMGTAGYAFSTLNASHSLLSAWPLHALPIGVAA